MTRQIAPAKIAPCYSVLRMRLHKPFIAIDLGGTIEDTWSEKRAWFAPRGVDLGSRPLSRIDIVGKSGVTDALYSEMVASVYSDNHILKHTLVAGCYEALMNISLRFRIILLSSRPESQRNVTIQWLRQNTLLHLVDDIALIGSDANKLSWCRSRSVLIFIDDDIRHLEPDNYETSVGRIHYTGRICQQRSPLHDQIKEASDWKNISHLIARLGAQPLALNWPKKEIGGGVKWSVY